MIVRAGTAPFDEGEGGGLLVYLSNAGGLTQFGAYADTLAPGADSSDRHWHSAEDELLYVLDGTATVVDNNGAHDLAPGDSAVWRAGVPNAHHVENRTDALCTYLIVGSRIGRDICTYPDSGRRLINTDTTWDILDADGIRIKGGDLPPHLLNLRPDWTTPAANPWPHPAIVRAAEARPDASTPDQEAALGAFTARLFSDTGGLAQFGAFTETLAPGAFSSHRHWHEQEDEFLYVVDGTPTVIENDGPHALAPGDAACWPAGVPNAHHVQNRSDAPCTYLVIGTRLPSDTVHYAEIDRIYRRIDGTVTRTRRDGSPL
jgi:uncharacterized cupin superfamily protein